jgi:hypothetical protein
MITDPIAQLLRRVEELERRVRRIVYQGTVIDVDKTKHMVRVDDGFGDTDADPHKTDWLCWVELAGSGRSRARRCPIVGQAVTVICPSGAGNRHKIGDNVSVKLDDNLITLKVGNSTITSEPNQITLTSDTIATVAPTLGLDSKSDTLVPNVLLAPAPLRSWRRVRLIAYRRYPTSQRSWSQATKTWY